MKKANRSKPNGRQMRTHYEIPWDKVVRGKYSGRFRRECYFVPIDPELKSAFPDADAINAALHELAAMKSPQLSGKPRRKSA